jgi:LysM repeat protein
MAVLSSVLLLGSILLSYAEKGYALGIPTAGTQTITAVPKVTLASGMPYYETTTPGYRPTDTPTFTPNPDCIPPEGFKVYIVRPGDTLSSLAHEYSTNEKTILKASCIETAGLSSPSLVAGSVIFVPDIHPTSVLPDCNGAPYGWVAYIVQTGDTLFGLSLVTHVSVLDLQTANCMGSSIYIYPGKLLYLPSIPYSPPLYTAVYPPTVTPSATAFPTAAQTPLLPPSWTPAVPATNVGTILSATPGSAPSPTATNNPSPTASDTPAFQPPTNTPIPPDTDTPLPPPTNTPVPPPTNTPVPPPTDTPVPPSTDTPVPAPREITPDLPEATAGVGLHFYSLIMTFLTV